MRRFLHILCFGASLTAAHMHQKSIQLLCFGDSLTAGYLQGGRLYHPYAGALKSSLEKSFPSINITVDIQGRNGDQVTSPPGGFLPRMDILYEGASQPYTYAIILGGTNDLSQNRLPSPIFTALQSVWAIPLSYGTKVLALTVPENGNRPDVINRRGNALNELILGFEKENFYNLDLCKELPYFSMPDEKRKEIWDDGTHFTTKGYDLVGTIVADRIAGLISETERLGREGEEAAGNSELKKREPQAKKSIKEKREVPQRGTEGKMLRSGKGLVREVEELAI